MIEEIANLVRRATGEREVEITIPEHSRFGHYATNLAFRVAQAREIQTLEAAKEIRDKILHWGSPGFFEKIEIAGPGFLNFFLSDQTLECEMKKLLRLGRRYGSRDIGAGQTIVIDYSAPNIAKPMNIGHLRSTIIGQALVNILRFLGYRVIGDNHLGDWGTQFGALLYAYKKWGNYQAFRKNPMDYLVGLYVRFHWEAEINEALFDEARNETAKLQSGDKENRRLWKIFVRESLKEFNKIYKRLNVKFDVVLGESFYAPMLEEVVKEALLSGRARKEDGAVKVFFEGEDLPAMVIQKSDGSFLYSTTDLATIKYRVKRFQPSKILYVVSNEQTLHFKQVFRAAEELGFVRPGVLEHIKFGMMLGESGRKMSTRRGEFIKLEEVLDKAVLKAKAINPVSAEAVGIGAVKYYDLSHYRESDIVFDWEEALNLKGNSGPYLQYAYVRIRGIMKKAGHWKKKFDIRQVKSGAEREIIRQLIYFPDAVMMAAKYYAPNYLTNYLFRLAMLINAFYEKEDVLRAEKPLREARLCLVYGAGKILEQGLRLLGLKTVSRM